VTTATNTQPDSTFNAIRTIAVARGCTPRVTKFFGVISRGKL